MMTIKTIDNTLTSIGLRKKDASLITDPNKLDPVSKTFATRVDERAKNSNVHHSDKDFTATKLDHLILSPHTRHFLTEYTTTTTIQHVRVSNENIAFITVLKRAANIDHLYLVTNARGAGLGASFLISKETRKDILKDGKNIGTAKAEGIQDSYIDLTDAKVVRVFTKSQAFDKSVVYDEIQLMYPFTDGTYDEENAPPLPSKQPPKPATQPITATPTTATPSTASASITPTPRPSRPRPRPIRPMSSSTRRTLIITLITMAILGCIVFSKLLSKK